MLEVDHLTKSYAGVRDVVHAIGDVSFDVDAKEFVSVVGPSGCGKTTLLKCVSGLLPVTRGTISLDGGRIDGPPDAMALVFQEYGRSLFPWLTVRGNVSFPLRRKRLAREEARRRVEEEVDAVDLLRFIDRYPWQLSGGMQQRVAIARALAYEPEILLMDESFASVDAQTRSDLEDLILRVRHEFGVTVLFVTHDIDEAVYLSDRVVVLTPPPTSVHEILAIELPRPRDQVATKELPEFTQLRTQLYQAIKRRAVAATSQGPA